MDCYLVVKIHMGERTIVSSHGPIARENMTELFYEDACKSGRREKEKYPEANIQIFKDVAWVEIETKIIERKK